MLIMKICFRMDDITPDMDWEKFNNFCSILNRNDIKPLIGVVPDNKDPQLKLSSAKPEFWDIVKSLQNEGWIVAQHGYQHIFNTDSSGILNINNYSEFAGLEYEKQYSMIADGKKIMEEKGVSSDVFMAPAHSYDLSTLKALKDLGFRYVTDGYALQPYDYKGLKFLPCQTSKPLKIPFGLLTVCIHSNNLKESDFQKIEEFIIENRPSIINYSEALSIDSRNVINPRIEKLVLFLRKIRRVKKFLKAK